MPVLWNSSMYFLVPMNVMWRGMAFRVAVIWRDAIPPHIVHHFVYVMKKGWEYNAEI